jgi:hypothetical protein
MFDEIEKEYIGMVGYQTWWKFVFSLFFKNKLARTTRAHAAKASLHVMAVLRPRTLPFVSFFTISPDL